MSAILRGNIRMALSGVRSSKWRSFLTMLGVIVGIVAVVTVVGIGEGVKRQVAGTLNEFGQDLIIVRPPSAPGTSVSNGAGTDPFFGMANTLGLSAQDIETVRKTPGVTQSTTLGLVPGKVEVFGKTKSNAKIIATDANMPVLLNHGVPHGDFWSTEDEGLHYAVLGPQAAEDLFDEPVPLGKSFTFRGQTFMVRGVLAPFKQTPFSPTANFDRAVFISYKMAATLTDNTASPYVILAKPASAQDLPDTMSAIGDRLAAHRGGERDFQVLDPVHGLAQGNETVQLLTVWILAVAVISLIMGGVGIMNTMLLVVTERLYEIGVRKAVGASSRQILGQFVLEAVVLSVLGGFIGCVLSLASIGLLRIYTDLDAVISWPAIGIAAGMSIVIGVVFGTIPAIKAASKDPIEALRHE